MKEHEGLITESLPNGMFRVRLDNEDLILGYVSGKIRRSFIRILSGDRIVEVFASNNGTPSLAMVAIFAKACSAKVGE
ncbi:hypothetical protein LIER_08394 [Lithospermum erythrorhizon]|uniref:S1-like domain-containing protein n=1 Tax=Lithospermum erythrorhizon TaxID=34254 RepID=A0AAV3PDE8_LITER